MSIKEQRKDLRELEARLKDINKKLSERNPFFHPDVVKARKELDDTIKKVSKQIETLTADLVKEQKEVEAKVQSTREAVRNAERDSVPKHIRDIVEGFTIGVQWSGELRVRWVSADQRYFILTVGGGSYWSGIGERYGETEHSLHDTTLFNEDAHGYDNYTTTMIGKHPVNGRLSSVKKSELIAQVFGLK